MQGLGQGNEASSLPVTSCSKAQAGLQQLLHITGWFLYLASSHHVKVLLKQGGSSTSLLLTWLAPSWSISFSPCRHASRGEDEFRTWATKGPEDMHPKLSLTKWLVATESNCHSHSAVSWVFPGGSFGMKKKLELDKAWSWITRKIHSNPKFYESVEKTHPVHTSNQVLICYMCR